MITLYQQATVTDDHWIHVQHPQLPAGTEVGVVLIFGQTLISPQPAGFWERIQGMTVDGLPSDYSSRFEEYSQSEESL